MPSPEPQNEMVSLLSSLTHSHENYSGHNFAFPCKMSAILSRNVKEFST